jgi:predicted N-acetyltransferase YhbS
MDSYTTRAGTPDDAEEIIAVSAAAFDARPDEQSRRNMIEHAAREAGLFRIVEVNARIVSVAKVHPHRLRVGRACEVLKGDVGGVATHPDFQRRGYGHALMLDVVDWMRREGYDLSRLGGYARFYRQFGYVPFPRRYVAFPIGPVRAGATTIPAEEVHHAPEGLPGVLRSYDAARDAVRHGELYEMLNGQRSGALVRDGEAELRAQAGLPSKPDPLQVVYELGGLVQGYAIGAEARSGIHGEEPAIAVNDIAFNPDCPEALVAVIQHILHEACSRSLRLVTARLPFDEAVLSILREAGITLRLEEAHEGIASNMMRIVNIESLFRKIAPELARRLDESGVSEWLVLTGREAMLEIRVDGEQVALAVAPGAVTVSDAASADGRLVTDQATLVKLIFGMLSFDEAVITGRGELNFVSQAVFRAWFPRQGCYGGWTLG